jgi:N-acetyl-alpha-D-muramate 1-phosphate uridylyltransferase
MILAAGRGERLRPMTDAIPKALVEVCGQSLLERHLVNIQRAGIRNVVINLGWLGAKIQDRVGDGRAFGLDVRYSDEGDNVLETGGGIHRALPMLGDQPFLVVNADVFTDIPVPDIALRDESVGHLVLVDTPDYRRQGDFDLDDGKVKNGQRPALTYSGIALYRPEFFSNCEPGRFSIVPMLQDAADKGQLQGSYYDGIWADVGTPERLKAINGGKFYAGL